MIESQPLPQAPALSAASENALAQHALPALARQRFATQTFDACPHRWLAEEMRLRTEEIDFVESHRAMVRPLVAEVPLNVHGFLEWLEHAQAHGPGQHDPLFVWLEEVATRAEFRWFLRQEVAGEAGFDDLVAMTQVKLPTRAKLEMARNYWDEMGRGQERAMHGPMLSRLAQACKLDEIQAPILQEAAAVGHMMTALACNRCYLYQSIGALGAIEVTAWRRAEKVNAGLKRLGYKGRDRIYYAVHATLDKKHGEAWTREVFLPMVEEQPKAARLLAEGMLLRMTLGARSYAAYRRVLWSSATHHGDAHAAHA